MSVQQVQEQMPSAEFTDWLAYYAVEAELATGERAETPPSPDQLGDKIRAMVQGLNQREPR